MVMLWWKFTGNIPGQFSACLSPWICQNKNIFKFKCLKPRKSHNRRKRCLHSKCVLSDRNKFTELWIICNSNHFILKPNKIFFTAYIQTSQSRLTCQLNSQNECTSTLNVSTLNIPDFIIHHLVFEYFQSRNLVENLRFAELDKIMDDDIWHPQKLKMWE